MVEEEGESNLLSYLCLVWMLCQQRRRSACLVRSSASHTKAPPVPALLPAPTAARRVLPRLPRRILRTQPAAAAAMAIVVAVLLRHTLHRHHVLALVLLRGHVVADARGPGRASVAHAPAAGGRSHRVALLPQLWVRSCRRVHVREGGPPRPRRTPGLPPRRRSTAPTPARGLKPRRMKMRSSLRSSRSSTRAATDASTPSSRPSSRSSSAKTRSTPIPHSLSPTHICKTDSTVGGK
jgi:hypothetical protein